MPSDGKPNYRRVMDEASGVLKRFSVIHPPVDPVDIARKLGVSVNFVQFSGENNDISGFYDCEDNTIYVNEDEYPLRQTFTVAHELGHHLLHVEWAKSENYKVLLRDGARIEKDIYEKEADAFAAHLLVPRALLDQYWQSFSVSDLSDIFAVSVPVIRNRLGFEYGI